jgi:membrane protease YdiL (CAAX protease family)
MSKPSIPEDRVARSLRGFGPVGILAVLVILLVGNDHYLPLGGILVLLWAWRSHTPWRELGFVRPKSWILTAAAGIAFGVAFKLLMKAIVMPLLGADPVNHAYHYLAGNRASLPGAIYTFIVSAGFGEETVFRGYLFERLGKIFGTSVRAKTVTVIITAALFALAHLSGQGIAGAEQAIFTGLLFGTMFAITGNLWMPMFAHAAFDLTALAIICLNLEPAVAHIVFR